MVFFFFFFYYFVFFFFFFFQAEDGIRVTSVTAVQTCALPIYQDIPHNCNLGLKRVAAGDHGESYRDLLYARNRFLTKETMRAAITEVVNAIFRIRLPQIWGEGTTACASDSKKFSAWDQNLMTEWHARYRGPGVLIYWHVERKATCIYSQLKQCSSTEVAPIITRSLRLSSDIHVDRKYVDTHSHTDTGL